MINIFLFVLLPWSALSTECLFDPLNLRPTPILINENKEIIYPDSRTRVATIVQEESISICCPGNHLILNNTILNNQCLKAKCVSGNLFNILESDTSIYNIKCQDIPNDTIRYTRAVCSEGGQEIEIGYDLEGTFIRQIKLCFDNINLTPFYSYFNLTRTIGYRDSKVPRKFFEEDGFYSTSSTLDNLYRRGTIRNTINNLIDISPQSDVFVKNQGELFVNRGHLTAKGDFVYNFQQLATFHYANSAPQWASINGGNWNEIEISVRDYAHARNVDLEIYTGVYGTSVLKRPKDGVSINLYLHTINNKNLMPIPRLFWKAIYNRNTQQGIVLVAINNPYETDLSNSIICEDLSDRVSWLNGKVKSSRRNMELGYIYACSVPSFRNIVKQFPNITVNDLLLS